MVSVNVLTSNVRKPMTVTGPTFIALQVRDVQRSAAFYTTHLGLRPVETSPPGADVLDTAPATFAVR